MVVKSLGYDSLRCVMEYMEANKRFEISQRIPSLSNIDRIVPLSIDTLRFKQNEVQVNNVSYKLGIIQCRPNASIPDIFKSINSSGGEDRDLDRFGFKDRHSDLTTTPGDIAIIDPIPNRLFLLMDDGYEEQICSLEKHLKVWETLLNKAEEGSNEQMDYKERVDGCKCQLLKYYCRRDNTPSPYERFIQLTITKESESGKEIKKEVMNYTKKSTEALKYLSTFLFGKRRIAINVRKLEIDHDPIVLRLPENLKLNVKELDVNCYAGHALKPLNPILQNSCIDEMTVCSLGEGDLMLEHVKKAKSLIMKTERYYSWRRLVRRLQNPKVHIEYGLHYREYMTLIQYWMEVGKPIGTCYTFHAEYDQDIRVLKSRMKFEEIINPDRSKVFVAYADVIDDPSQQLKISITTVYHKKTWYHRESKWLLKVEVIERT